MREETSPPGPESNRRGKVSPRVVPAIRSALDLLNLAAVFVESDGRIVFANRAARALLLQSRGLRNRGGRLRAVTPRGAQILDRELRAILSAAPHRQRDRGTLIRLPGDRGNPTVVSIHTSQAGSALAGDENLAILFINDLAVESGIDERMLTALYDLTLAEAKLLHALLQGQRLSEYAARAGITLNTAKGYVKQLFGKTGAQRQADLVRIVLSNSVLRLGQIGRRHPDL